MPEYLPNSRYRPLSRFSIYRNPSQSVKRRGEAEELMPFLLKLEQFMDLADVEFGEDPPDFVFLESNDRIGVEVTTVNPALFGPGGYLRKKDFRAWKEEIEKDPAPEQRFEWGTFTLKESLESLKEQFRIKIEKTQKWSSNFAEKWLLLHLDSGSPFGILVGTEQQTAPGREEDYRDHQAKVLFEVCRILEVPHPFNRVIMFCGTQLVAFLSPCGTKFKLPVRRADIVARGAQVSDSHLIWSMTHGHSVTRQ